MRNGERSLTSLCGEVGARVFRGAIRQAARADIVAAILARRILHVGPPGDEGAAGAGAVEGGVGGAEGGGGGGGGGGGEESQQSGGDGEYRWGGGTMGTIFGEAAAAAGMTSVSSREALGTALVVLAAESAFRLQRGVVRRSPGLIQRAAAPVSLGLQVAREVHSHTTHLIKSSLVCLMSLSSHHTQAAVIQTAFAPISFQRSYFQRANDKKCKST